MASRPADTGQGSGAEGNGERPEAEERRRLLAAGAAAEARVAEMLAGEGWAILARNWRGGGGELDVVVDRGGDLRFVEVKLRDLCDPLADEAVNSGKRSRLRSAARAWLLGRGEPDREVCFLVAIVHHDPAAGTTGHVEWLDDAFDG